MGKRTRSQRKGSSPRYRVSSHRFPGANRLPSVKDEVVEVVDLVHSPIHTAPLAKLKSKDGKETFVAATDGMSVGQQVAVGENITLKPGNITTLKNIPEGKRQAKFSTVMAYVDGKRELIAEGFVKGIISNKIKGIGGFGYDSIFYVVNEGKTFAEMGDEEKNAISHRGVAFRSLKEHLNNTTS